jgi:hypothetical protein
MDRRQNRLIVLMSARKSRLCIRLRTRHHTINPVVPAPEVNTSYHSLSNCFADRFSSQA